MSRPPRFDPHQVLPGASDPERSAVLRRWSLDLLSTRGWLVTGFSSLCVLLAYLLGRHELMALGCALLALVLGAWLIVRFGSTTSQVHRTLPQEPISVGQLVDVGLHCPEAATIREVLPEGYPAAPVFQAPGRFDYEIIFRRRGIHRLGPAQQLVGDPCGLVDGMVDTAASDNVAVRAQCQALGSSSALGERMLTGEARHTQSAEVDYYDVGIRDHQQGDSMRQVHWKATARHGKLMVRQENYVATAHSLIVLDRRQSAWHTPAEQVFEIPHAEAPAVRSTQRFEKALSLSCSIASLYAARGYQLMVQDTAGQELSSEHLPGFSASAALDRFEDFHAATATLGLVQDQAQPARTEMFSGSLNKTLLGFADEPVFLVLGELNDVQARWLASLASTVRNVDLFLLCAHPGRQRELASHFASTSWRFHLPAASWGVRDIWGNS